MDENKDLNKKLLDLEGKSYAPKLLVMNQNGNCVFDEQHGQKINMLNNIEPNYIYNFFARKCVYSYNLKLDQQDNKCIQLILQYFGKGICDKISITKIFITKSNEQKKEIKISEGNIKMLFQDKTDFDLNMYINLQDDKKLIELEIDVELYIFEEKYKERIFIKFINDDVHEQNVDTYIKSIEYESEEEKNNDK